VAAITRFVLAHKRLVALFWVVLTVVGIATVNSATKAMDQKFSVPGKEGWETNVAITEHFHGTGGDTAPIVPVVTLPQGKTVNSPGVDSQLTQMDNKLEQALPGARIASFSSTGDRAFVSKDGRTTFAIVYPQPDPNSAFGENPDAAKHARAAMSNTTIAGAPVHVSGFDALQNESGGDSGTGVLLESVLGGVGALIVLAFVFASFLALLPMAMAIVSIMTSFLLVWGLTVFTDVSPVVQFLIALVGLGIAIDYSLLMIFRFRDELREGNDVESALVETMTHAGHSVIISGTTVAIGLLAMVLLPLPLLRSMGIGGMLIPVVSVLATLTLLPAMLAVLGHRVNSVRVVPKRFQDQGHPEDGAWGRWARFVLRRPLAVAAVGVAIVAVLAGLGTQLNPNEAQLKYFPGSGTAIAGRAQLAAAGISPGVMKPLNVLVEHGGNPQQVAAKLAKVRGVSGASAPPGWRKGQNSFVEAFPTIDGAAPGIQGTIDRANTALDGTNGTLTGISATDRDFLHALFGSFPLALGLVLLLTLILLTRAFRSVVLAVKAVVLNLLSLAATFGIVVFIFQEGHGSSLWGIAATQSITAYIPVMIFAFLFGLSMDYEVFMLSRMREAYDETGSTGKAIELGLARTGKLVTSGALILMFAFLVLSSTPGYEVKSLAIGIAAGVIFDATVIRALLVPALMKLLGDWNWWMPRWMGVVLRVRTDSPRTAVPETPPVPVV